MKTPDKIFKQLERMVDLSMDFEYNHLTQDEGRDLVNHWLRVAHSIDKTCAVVNKYFQEQEDKK